METTEQPPPGYPSENPPAKKKCCPHSTKKGSSARNRDRGCIEGCLAVLCCWWLCEACSY